MSCVLRNSFTQVTTYIKMENIHLSCASIICRSYSVVKRVVAAKIFHLEVVCIYVQWKGWNLPIHAPTYSQISHRKKL